MTKVDEETGEVTESRAFGDLLIEMRDGLTHSEMTNSLSELVEAVSAYHKGGTLTLTIKIEPAGDGKVEVTDKIKLKAPEPDRSTSLFFVDKTSSLQRNNPYQNSFDLREVPTGEHAQIREIK